MEISTNSNLPFHVVHKTNNSPRWGVASTSISTPDVSGFQRDVGVDDSIADLGAVCEVDSRMVLQRCRRRTIDVVDVPTAPTTR